MGRGETVVTKWLGLAALVLLMVWAVPSGDGRTKPGPSSDELVFSAPNGTVLQISLQTLGDSTYRERAVEALRATTLKNNPNLTDLAGQEGSGWVAKEYAWPTGPVAFQYNPDGAPANLDGVDDSIAAAASTWNNAGANFGFASGGTTSDKIGACGVVSDGKNTIGWASLDGSLLAVTCTLYRPDGPAPHKATEFDMQLDPKWDWTTTSPPTIDLQTVVTHELGHALGLGHSADPSTVMFANGSSGSLKRDLTSTDIAGAVAIYGAKPAAETQGQVPLTAGANLIVWTGATAAPEDVLAGSSLVAIYSFDTASNSWLRYIPGLSPTLNTLRSVSTGHAYWIIVTADRAPAAA